MRSDHAFFEDAIGAYVLGAGEPGEADEVRAHLDTCASCRELAARLGRAVAALPLAVEEVAPPGRLRERILAAAASDPVPVSMPARAPARRALHVDLPRYRGGRWALALAAAVLLVAGVGLGRITTSSVSTLHYGLNGAGSASVVEFRGAGTTLVEFHGLGAPAAGHVYQLWLIPSGGTPVSGGVFMPDADGSKVLVLSRDLNGVGVMAVTSEPGPDGSSQPTAKPFLSGGV